MVPLPRLFSRKGSHTAEGRSGEKTTEAIVVAPDLLVAARSLFRTSASEDAAELKATCQEAAEANPNLARALLRLGLVLYDNGEPDTALQTLTTVVRRGKDSGLTNQHCALAQAALGCCSFAVEENRFAEGLSAFQQALGHLASMVDFAPAPLKYAISLYHSGSSDIALQTLEGMKGPGTADELFGTDRPLASCLLACCMVESRGASIEALQALHETYVLLRKDFSVSPPQRNARAEPTVPSR
jgi:tetratricopeptide (TPR) repeat protein